MLSLVIGLAQWRRETRVRSAQRNEHSVASQRLEARALHDGGRRVSLRRLSQTRSGACQGCCRVIHAAAGLGVLSGLSTTVRTVARPRRQPTMTATVTAYQRAPVVTHVRRDAALDGLYVGRAAGKDPAAATTPAGLGAAGLALDVRGAAAVDGCSSVTAGGLRSDSRGGQGRPEVLRSRPVQSPT